MPLDRRRKRDFLGLAGFVLAAFSLFSGPSSAGQIDIHGPPHSVAFGKAVTVLPTGNIVVCDPDFGASDRKFGAVYLYSPTGALISALRGNSAGDHVGSQGIKLLAGGNFAVLSPTWNNGKATAAGAVTWVDGHLGLSGVVSTSNSLVGSQANDGVGNGGVTLLANGNYVVSSYSWNNGTVPSVGAVTWIDGGKPLTGAVTAENSLVGTEANEVVGAQFSILPVAPLPNGNYVVANPSWHRDPQKGGVGAVMLADGTTGARGTFTESNSLVGTVAGDAVGSGGIVVLGNGNYVVSSPIWSNHDVRSVGAVTWVDGTLGLVDRVSVNNSLVGSTPSDYVGTSFSTHPIVALANGNYVVSSMFWNNGAIHGAGAVTWGDGSKGTTGVVSAGNSLVGSAYNDWVGIDRVAALSNGNYVVGSSHWHNGLVESAGAVTWADGTTGLSGPVSTGNSLVGTGVFNSVGSQGIRALSNGNYVVPSPRWSVAGVGAGAITWANGNSGLVGTVSAANSLIGLPGSGGIGAWGVAALSNGNYVAGSPLWGNGTATRVGAVTWADGTTGLAGVVDASNSLVGETANDEIGYNFAYGLGNGNYVVASPDWSNGGDASVGAVTWGSGRTGISGPVSAFNSLVGIAAGDSIGSGFDHYNGFETYSNSTYVVGSPHFHNGAMIDAGAVSVIRGTGGTVGPVNVGNSVIGTTAGGGQSMVFDYDPTHDTLVVGQPASNVVSLFKSDLLFASGFE
jgi:hypothetical protein